MTEEEAVEVLLKGSLFRDCPDCRDLIRAEPRGRCAGVGSVHTDECVEACRILGVALPKRLRFVDDVLDSFRYALAHDTVSGLTEHFVTKVVEYAASDAASCELWQKMKEVRLKKGRRKKS